ncbi:hypothetical protein C8R41DRAFT_864694 [Lentinula lateritia]|uniref:Uncharacterized protein n=1 Tax=Lentinula lateritia TaxID=40482 RepID=A0ABQ8VQ84_9AGAR|nr:hypothetical protein C8R41DRAFT_864694 [Lentinula lateritia]
MDVESRSALGKISDIFIEYVFLQSLKHYFNNTSINNSTCKSRAKAQEAKSKAVRSLKKREVYSRLFYESECKEKVDAAIAAFGPAITKGDRMVIRNKHTNAGYQAAQLDPVKMAAIEKYLAEENSKRNEDTTSPVVDEDTGEIQKLTGEEHVKFMRVLPTTLAEVSTRLAKLGGLCTMFVAAGMDPDNENKIRGYGFHVGKDVHGQPFFRAIPDYTERVFRPFLNFASAAFVAEDNPSTTSLSTSADRDTSEVANSPPLTVVADGSESLPVSSEHPAGASPTACATESMSEITATPIAPSHNTNIGLTDPPSDILPTLSSPFPILSSPMPTSSFPLDNCGELPVMPTSPTLPTPTVSSAILGTPPVVVTPSCQPMTRSLSYPLIPFQPEEQSSHSTRSLSLPPPSSADVSLSLLLGDSSTARAVDQLPEPVSQAPQSYSWSRMTDHEFDAVIATGLNNNQLFEWDSTGALPELNQPVGPLIGEKTGSVDSGLSVFPFAQDIDSNALVPGSPTIGPTIAENVGSMNSGLLAFPFAQDINSNASIPGSPTIGPTIAENVGSMDSGLLAFPFAQDINSNSSTPGPPTIGPPIVENIEGVDGGLLAFPFGLVASIAGPPTLSPPIVGNSRLAFPSAQDINTLLSTTSNVFGTEVPDPLIVESTVDTGNDMSSLVCFHPTSTAKYPFPIMEWNFTQRRVNVIST